jgi:hypothetical protein
MSIAATSQRPRTILRYMKFGLSSIPIQLTSTCGPALIAFDGDFRWPCRAASNLPLASVATESCSTTAFELPARFFFDAD